MCAIIIVLVILSLYIICNAKKKDITGLWIDPNEMRRFIADPEDGVNILYIYRNPSDIKQPLVMSSARLIRMYDGPELERLPLGQIEVKRAEYTKYMIKEVMEGYFLKGEKNEKYSGYIQVDPYNLDFGVINRKWDTIYTTNFKPWGIKIKDNGGSLHIQGYPLDVSDSMFVRL
jgi:hypothetical protein